ncbi:hypothetical protein [Novimethylophilus kurashikiensis]|nr:hypothetical protein [Novimethylophilus kurashikiensis]
MDDFFGSGTDRNWYKYRSGTRVPTHATLAAVEKRCAGSRAVFDLGPGGVMLWAALAAPHAKLWEVIDVIFPEQKEWRNRGLLGIQEYAIHFERKLLPENYKAEIDYIAHSKGEQRNAVYLAYSRGEVKITPEVVAGVIAFWRLCSLVIFNMLSADYLLSGMMHALYDGQIFAPKLISAYGVI